MEPCFDIFGPMSSLLQVPRFTGQGASVAAVASTEQTLLRVGEPCFIASTVPREHHRSTWHPFTTKGYHVPLHTPRMGVCAEPMSSLPVASSELATASLKAVSSSSAAMRGRTARSVKSLDNCHAQVPAITDYLPCRSFRAPSSAWTQMITECQAMPTFQDLNIYS